MSRNIIAEKSELRKHFKALRSRLSQDEVAKYSQEINKNFIENLLPKFLAQKPNATFSLYFSTYNEVATEVIAEHFIKNKIIFSYPKIVAKDAPLEFVKHAPDKALEASTFYKKILEIKDGEKIIPDFIILPLVAFDKNKNRLGMGGGFFDRTLAHFLAQNYKIATIALAYDCQLCEDTLPTEKNDSAIDFIVSPTHIFL